MFLSPGLEMWACLWLVVSVSRGRRSVCYFFQNFQFLTKKRDEMDRMRYWYSSFSEEEEGRMVLYMYVLCWEPAVGGALFGRLQSLSWSSVALCYNKPSALFRKRAWTSPSAASGHRRRPAASLRRRTRRDSAPRQLGIHTANREEHDAKCHRTAGWIVGADCIGLRKFYCSLTRKIFNSAVCFN